MAIVLLTTLTASSDATLSFTSKITSTHNSYIFDFIDLHPETNDVDFTVQFNASGGSGYNETITSNVFRNYNTEAAGSATLATQAGLDQEQGTSFQVLGENVGNDADGSFSGTFTLFGPGNGTHATQFYGIGVSSYSDNAVATQYTSGYINVATAITEVQFKFSADAIDSGKIKMYGVL